MRMKKEQDNADRVYQMVMTELEYQLFSGQVYALPAETAK